ncbi:MAG: hypothetical protein WA435_12915 [Gallionellaceae bacterium]
MRWLNARGGWGTLRVWHSMLDSRLPDTSLCWSSLLGSPQLRLCLLNWRTLRSLSLELLPRYGVVRLVTIILLLKRMLLLDLLGIPIP